MFVLKDYAKVVSATSSEGFQGVVRTGFAVQTACRIKELKFFDTRASSKDADKFAGYLDHLPVNEHVLLVTVGDAFKSMTARAFDALSSAGIDIADVAEEGQTFVALIVIGSHCRTVHELFEQDPAFLALKLNGYLLTSPS